VSVARSRLIALAATLIWGYTALAVAALSPKIELPWRLFYVDRALQNLPYRTKLWYTLNTELRPDPDREYLGRYGWSERTDWGAWIDAQQASLFLRLSDAPTQNLHLRVRWHGDGRNPQIVADVTANGTSVARWTIDCRDPESEREAEIPASLIPTDHLLQLTFRLRDPPDAPGGLDLRRRLGVISVTLGSRRQLEPPSPVNGERPN
jgi:hypothetical protein